MPYTETKSALTFNSKRDEVTSSEKREAVLHGRARCPMHPGEKRQLPITCPVYSPALRLPALDAPLAMMSRVRFQPV
jgi:hypothetical protein